MAEGDAADQLSKQLSLIPQGWTPEAGDTAGTLESPHPVLDAILSGFGALWALCFSLIEYTAAQMRLPTSTDGFLELAALDYFGQGEFPRLAGEPDVAYAARIEANILPPGSTRAAISAAIEALTGQAPRIVEPWSPGDTGVWDGVQQTLNFWDEQGISWDQAGVIWDQGDVYFGGMYFSDTSTQLPGRFGGRDHKLAYQCFIDTIIPPVPGLGGAPVVGFDANCYFDASGSPSYFFDLRPSQAGMQAVLNVINKLKVEGTIVWVRFNAA